MVEKQQSADVAEQAHRLAHELGLAHGHHHPNSKAVSNRLARAIGHLEAVGY